MLDPAWICNKRFQILIQFEDQTAVFRISFVDIPMFEAVDEDAPLIEWALKIDVYIHSSYFQ